MVTSRKAYRIKSKLNFPSSFLLELFDSHDPEVGFGGIHGRGRRKQDPPIERELYLTLEEVFKGCVKKMKISRRVRMDVTLFLIFCEFSNTIKC